MQIQVLAVSHDNVVLWVDGPHAEEDARAALEAAIAQHGAQDCVYFCEPAGKYQAGDTWVAK